jgi:hypothetical protein
MTNIVRDVPDMVTRDPSKGKHGGKGGKKGGKMGAREASAQAVSEAWHNFGHGPVVSTGGPINKGIGPEIVNKTPVNIAR